jgi:hypothetical protein
MNTFLPRQHPHLVNCYGAPSPLGLPLLVERNYGAAVPSMQRGSSISEYVTLYDVD